MTRKSHYNDAYSWTDHYNVDRDYTANGLNQYTKTMVGTATTATYGYDANGNLTGDGTNSFVYDVENRLVSVSGARSGTLTYDPLGRLFSLTSGTNSTYFLHDGASLAVEYDGSGNMLRRYVHGAGTDAPVALYEGASTGVTNRDYYQPDERGSVMALVNHDGSNRAVKAYDEYGITNNPAPGRFGYTGQAWLDEIGLYYYKARMYSPTLGRFMQTDPIGYGDGMNMYAYVGGDPVNKVDPTGMNDCSLPVATGGDGRGMSTATPICSVDYGDIEVTGTRWNLERAIASNVASWTASYAQQMLTGTPTPVGPSYPTITLASATQDNKKKPDPKPDLKLKKRDLLLEFLDIIDDHIKIPWAESVPIDEFYRDLEERYRRQGDHETADWYRERRKLYAD